MITFVKVEYCSSLFYVNKSINEVSTCQPYVLLGRGEREGVTGDSVEHVGSEYVEQ